MKHELEMAIESIVAQLFGVNTAIELTRPDEQFGDYATNVALQLAKAVSRPPQEIGQLFAEKIRHELSATVSEVQVAGPGFINLTLSDKSLLQRMRSEPLQTLTGQVVLAEYSDPNPFKPLHAGHLYTTVIGDAIARLMEVVGAQVTRINYGGDVGLHVGKSMWCIMKRLDGDKLAALAAIPEAERPAWLGACYVAGNAAYEDDVVAREEIIAANKQVYELQANQDHDSEFAQVYWICRNWSYDYFQKFYADLAVRPFDRLIPESEIVPLAIKTIREQTQRGVYSESNGAIVFKGEAHGLHTRVFMTAHGLPTYDAKDVGLLLTKWHDYHFDRSVVITSNDQAQYMAVMLKSVEQFAAEPAERSLHLTHGSVKLRGGTKMSSRTGNVVTAMQILDAAGAANRSATGKDDPATVIGAVKYAFLKNRLGGDLIYDPDESVSLEGNSGPYLQYAHARASSILRKVTGEMPSEELINQLGDGLQPDEKSLVRQIGIFAEVVDKAAAEFTPHHICTYLYELAQNFNRFYEHNRVIGDERERLRTGLVRLYATTLHQGLELLGITAPDQM